MWVPILRQLFIFIFIFSISRALYGSSSKGGLSENGFENASDRCHFAASSSYAASSSGYESLGLTTTTKPDESLGEDDEREGESSSDADSDWGEDEWPCDRALPLPEWGTERPELVFRDVCHYESFLQKVHVILKDSIASLPYDTLTNFLNFSMEYQSNKEEYSSLQEFFKDYDPPILPGRYTCVGLSLDLITKLSAYESSNPGLKDAMYQVSCEEEIDQIDSYCRTNTPPVYSCEKEHVLVCIRLLIGSRPGVLLMDPGYHVTEPITVMEDEKYPQSEEIVYRPNKRVTKVYNYRFHSNPAFVMWDVKEFTEGELTKSCISLIHTMRPFLSSVDIPERRNLVYPFKSLLLRNREGAITAGVYFRIRSLESTRIICFYVDDEGRKQEAKIPITYFSLDKDDETYDINQLFQYESILTSIEAKLGYKWDIRYYLALIVTLLGDDLFFKQFIELNDAVDQISKDN